MGYKTEWSLKDILRLFEETQCPALEVPRALDMHVKEFIETDIKENVKNILSNTGRIWLAMPQKFPWDNSLNDSLVLAFTYDYNSEKYIVSSFYPDVRIKEDDGNYFLDIVIDGKMDEKQYCKMLKYNVDEMIKHLKNMIRKCSKLTKMIRRMNVKNCTKEWEA